MVNTVKSLASKKLSSADTRVIINLCNNPVATTEFIRVLEEAKVATKSEFEKTMQAYLITDEQKTRAMALMLKGKVDLIDEMISLIKSLTNMRE